MSLIDAVRGLPLCWRSALKLDEAWVSDVHDGLELQGMVPGSDGWMVH